NTDMPPNTSPTPIANVARPPARASHRPFSARPSESSPPLASCRRTPADAAAQEARILRDRLERAPADGERRGDDAVVVLRVDAEAREVGAGRMPLMLDEAVVVGERGEALARRRCRCRVHVAGDGSLWNNRKANTWRR